VEYNLGSKSHFRFGPYSHHFSSLHAWFKARFKVTTFYMNDSTFSSLALTCDGSHSHLPWTVTRSTDGVTFSTASEAEYPELLCQRLSSVAVTIAESTGAAQSFDPCRKRTQPISTQIREQSKRVDNLGVIFYLRLFQSLVQYSMFRGQLHFLMNLPAS